MKKGVFFLLIYFLLGNFYFVFSENTEAVPFFNLSDGFTAENVFPKKIFLKAKIPDKFLPVNIPPLAVTEGDFEKGEGVAANGKGSPENHQESNVNDGGDVDPSGWMEKKTESISTFFVNFWGVLKDEFAISSETEADVKTSFDFDFNTLFFGLSNGGLGLGFSMEKQIIPHFAFRGGLAHSIVGTNEDNLYCMTFSINTVARIYPMSHQLRKLYLGFGGILDYASYIDMLGRHPENNWGGLRFSFYPHAGYKFTLPKNFMIDLYLGYKFVYFDGISSYSEVSNFLNTKIQYGISIKYTKLYELFRNVHKSLQNRKIFK